MSLAAPVSFRQDEHAHLLPQIHQIHRDCILQDHQVLAFLPNEKGDVDDADLEQFWLDQCQPRAGAGKAQRELLLQLGDEQEVLGLVVLDMPCSETGPFRGFVQKLMVSVHHRRKGIARRLLRHAEEVAERNGRCLLMLDTPVGLPAEQSKIFEEAGYIEVGVIPNFSISPKDGSLIDEKFFYKDLRSAISKPGSNGHP